MGDHILCYKLNWQLYLTEVSSKEMALNRTDKDVYS